MAVSKRLRYEILRRDAFTCRYCGKRTADAPLEVDHVVPVALGGRDEPANLVAACADCNAGKAAAAPEAQTVEDVSADAIRWSEAMRQAADLQRSQRREKQIYLQTFWEEWARWNLVNQPDKGLPEAWRDSIGRFYEADLETATMIDCVSTAMNRPSLAVTEVFRYFCGVCWTIIRERQEIARELLAHDENGGGE